LHENDNGQISAKPAVKMAEINKNPTLLKLI